MDNVAINKMSAANMVRIFGPTLMTVDTDESSFLNATFEFSVIELMFRHYLWMFQVTRILLLYNMTVFKLNFKLAKFNTHKIRGFIFE